MQDNSIFVIKIYIYINIYINLWNPDADTCTIPARGHRPKNLSSRSASLASENSRPSSLPTRVAFRRPFCETPLGPGAKKDGCVSEPSANQEGFKSLTCDL